MIKPSKVFFISDDLEKDFNELKEDDPIKKYIIRAISDLRENAFAGIQLPKKLIPENIYKNIKLIIYGSMIYLVDGD